jgi:hypothetical protein
MSHKSSILPHRTLQKSEAICNQRFKFAATVARTMPMLLYMKHQQHYYAVISVDAHIKHEHMSADTPLTYHNTASKRSIYVTVIIPCSAAAL